MTVMVFSEWPDAVKGKADCNGNAAAEDSDMPGQNRNAPHGRGVSLPGRSVVSDSEAGKLGRDPPPGRHVGIAQLMSHGCHHAQLVFRQLLQEDLAGLGYRVHDAVHCARTRRQPLDLRSTVPLRPFSLRAPELLNVSKPVLPPLKIITVRS